VPNNKRIPIKDVARVAGVSTQTVSRVTNNRPDVSPETRRRVLDVIAELGYRPSRVARMMRGVGQAIGVVGYGLDLYGPSRTLLGVQLEAQKLNYGIVLHLVRDPNDIDIEGIMEKMLDNHVNGIVWCIPNIDHNMDAVQAYAEHATIPIFFTDTSPHPSISAISVDNRLGGRLATEHLIDQGHTRIGHIAGPVSYYAARERMAGWREALQSAHLRCDDSLVEEGDWTAHGGAQAFQTLIERHPDISAVFASNDQIALGVLWVARRRGLRVPDDLAVIGYDDIPEAEFFEPGLSSVRQDVIQLGTQAVIELTAIIAARQNDKELIPRMLWLKPEPVIRASTRPAEYRTR
jgi:LacI family transcriptional regulator